MNELGLKHLAPYLPYRLKCHAMSEVKDEYAEKADPVEFEIAGLNTGWVEIHEIGRTVTEQILYEETFPLLRPLSDLTKEIEVNDERFIPIQDLFHIAYESVYGYRFEGEFDDSEILKDHLALKASEIEWNYGFTVELPNHFIFSANGDHLTIPNFEMYYKLFEWHFDVFGLINHGLAIDLNSQYSDLKSK